VSRPSAAGRVLEQLDEVNQIVRSQYGLELLCDVFTSENEDPTRADEDVRQGGIIAARAYRASAADQFSGFIWLEDDILIHPESFASAMHQMLIIRRCITTFCLIRDSLADPSAIQDAITEYRRTGEVVLVPLHGVEKNRGFHGSMAVYVPDHIVQYMTRNPQQFESVNGRPIERIAPDRERGKITGFDFWLKDVSLRMPGTVGPMLAAFPNPVQHRDLPSVTRTLGKKRAPRRPMVTKYWAGDL
jgi:hypothetical protein